MNDATRLLTALVASVLVAGCGGKSTLGEQTICVPACPAGTHCEAEGCFANNPVAFDLSVPSGDSGGSCAPVCTGATPYCNANRVCVPCLEDRHCPAGQVCRTSGSLNICVPGCADDSRCDGHTCCGGACVDIQTDVFNCGGCGVTCSPMNARAVCQGGACAGGSCDSGWGDCNHDPADGCETNLTVDPKNCGGCGTACSIPNASAGCAATCYVRSCTFGFDDCNGDARDGCEKNVLSDPNNCGVCGRSCGAVPHARNTCINAACQLSSCDVGFADCDGNPVNGCEVSVFTDNVNCGRCGVACGQGLVCRNGGCTCPQCNFANASSKCVNNVCVLDQCTPGYTDCDNNAMNGCESNTDADRMNCGACGHPCGQMEACSKGMCIIGGVNAFGEFRPSMHCADFKNNGGTYQQYCFTLRGIVMCIGQTNGGKIACQDMQGGLHFTFDFGSTWPMRFTKNTPDCQNYQPDFLQNITLALGYNTFTVAQSKIGNSCTLTYIDNNGNFASQAGDPQRMLPYDVTFNF